MNYEKSLNDIIFNMLLDSKYFFYGLFLAEMNKEFSDKHPSAGVYKHKDASVLNLVIGKEFWEKVCKTDEERMGVLIHECEHVAREHIYDAAGTLYPNKIVANLAMDISINQYISQKLPRKDTKGKKCGAFIDDFKELKLPTLKGTMDYYNIIRAAKDKKEQSKGKEDSKNPDKKPGNKQGTSGSEYLDQILDNCDENGEASEDYHDGWKEIGDGVSDQEKELMRKEIQETIKRIAEETEKSRGLVPGHLADAIKNNFNNNPPVISWKTLFNRFIGSTITTDVYQTRKRLNFRFEDAPNNRYKNKIKIVVGCDTSGSVSDQELKEFFGQINHMWKAGVKVDVCLWDAECDDPYEYKGEHTYKRTRGGGTRASCFIEYVNKNKNKHNWTCAISLTDGYIENDPVKCKLPMLWVITKDGSTAFTHHAKKVKIN